jgi:calcium/calmodulin-dependent protein kinase I
MSSTTPIMATITAATTAASVYDVPKVSSFRAELVSERYEAGSLADRFTVGKMLGQGGCATVYLAHDNSVGGGDTNSGADSPGAVAVKRLDRKGFELAVLERELYIMRELVHPNIVRLLAAYQSAAFVDLVLELVQGGELFDAIVLRGSVDEADARSVLRQLSDGLLYVHARGVAHRDLKAENVLLARRDSLDCVKIADFGLANVCGTGTPLQTSCGTPDYVAPEILLGAGYGQAVDLWSLGILAYVLLCGYPPFWADSQSELFRKIIDGSYTFHRDDWADVSDAARNFVANLLVVQPAARMTARAALDHAWLAVGSITKPPPAHAKTSARNLADYNAARKAGSATYVPLPVRSAIGSPLAAGSPATPMRPAAVARAMLAAGATPSATTTPPPPKQEQQQQRAQAAPAAAAAAAHFSTPQTPPMAAGARNAEAHLRGGSDAGYETPINTPPSLKPVGGGAETSSSDTSEDDASSTSSSASDSLAALEPAAVQMAVARSLSGHDDAAAASSSSGATAAAAAAAAAASSMYSAGPTEAVYDLGAVLGRGGCAVVYEAQNRRTGGTVAVKRLSKAGFEMRLLERELKIMRTLTHPHILKLYDAFESAEYVDLVLEFVDGGELFDAIIANNGLAENDCARIMAQVLSALAYMHSHQVAHRDLKAENVLVSGDLQSIKIADFGLSNVLESATRLRTSCGTPDYVAPEVLKGEGYTEKVDVWSAGVLTYIMLCGYPPFYDPTQKGLFIQIIKGEFKYPSREWAHTTKLCRKFIRALIVVDPEARPRAADCLALPWLAGRRDALPAAARRGNSVANLRVYQAQRAADERPIPPQCARAVFEALEGSALGAVLRPERELLEDFFALRGELGRGGMATVFEATEISTGQRWAVKRVHRANVNASCLQRELAIMVQARHENILQLKAVYQSDSFVDVVTELALGGELFDLIVQRGSFTENDARGVMQQVFRGLEYLHGRGIAHRDLKAENVLVTEPPTAANGGRIGIKISDFGLANMLSDAAQLKTSCGTPDYVAPEVLLGDGYELSVDVWSAGVLAYILLCGYPPFHAETEVLLFKKIMDVDYQFDPKVWGKVSDDARDFVCHLLVGDPQSRFTATEALAHRWLAASASKRPPAALISGGAASSSSTSSPPLPSSTVVLPVVAAGALPVPAAGDELNTAFRLSPYRRRRKKERSDQADAAAAERAKESASRSARRRRKAERQAKPDEPAAAAAAAAAAAVVVAVAAPAVASAVGGGAVGAASTAPAPAVATTTTTAPASASSSATSTSTSSRRAKRGTKTDKKSSKAPTK